MHNQPDGLIPRFLHGFNAGLTPRNLAILAILCALVVVVVGLGCILKFDGKASYIGIIVIMVYLFTFFPLMLTKLARPGSGLGGRPPPIYHIAYFLVGAFAVSGPWLTFILYRSDKITPQAAVLIMAGGLLAILPLLLFNYLAKKDSEHGGF